MSYHQKAIIDNSPLTLDPFQSGSPDMPYVAMKILSLLVFQVLDKINSFPSQVYQEAIDRDFFSYIVSSILAALTSVCEILYVFNRSGQRVYSSMKHHDEGLKCINILSCGCLWLSTILSNTNSCLQQCQSNSHEILESPMVVLAESILEKVVPVALSCLKCIAQTLENSNSSGSCLRLCLSLIRSSASLACTYRDIKKRLNGEGNKACDNENLLGGINDDMLMAIDLDNLMTRNDKDKKEHFLEKMLEFLVNALNESKVIGHCTLCISFIL